MNIRESEIIIGVIFLILIIGGIVTLFLVNKSFCGDGVCQEGERNLCIADCDWCGDGYCQEEEKGVCSFDCDWCGDGFCQEHESCSSCEEDCESCKADAYCGDGVCNKGECETGCTKDCRLINCQNGICETSKGENCVTTPGDCKCKSDQKCNTITKKCEDITCGNGRCDSGETPKTCPADCKEDYTEVLLDPNRDFSIVFVHGHSPKEITGYSPTELEGFQKKLANEGYENMGFMLPSDYPPKLTKGVWSGKKVSVIMTYYANKYDKLGNIVGPDDNQHIKVYAQRLRDVVETVKHNTGKNKVIIIAHSMGGLVCRAYIKYYGGINSVDKLVTIGTPNHGTHGIIAFGCDKYIPILHEREFTPECGDMEAGSAFLTDLNSGDETPGNVKYLTIVGLNKNYESCPNGEKWDGVVCSSSVRLEGAENFEYTPLTSYDGKLHIDLVFPSKMPEIYNKIVDFLKEG